MTTSCLPRAFRYLAIAVLTLTALGLRAASPATFDIPAQPAPAALKQFIKQSGTQVVYIRDDLKAVTTKAVKGDLVPANALAQLLDGTGFSVETMANGNFTISRPVALKPGSIEGTIRDNDSGRAVAGARVAIAGTELSVLSDKRGRFTFAEAPTGDQELHITAEGMQNTTVTDVTVKPGHRQTISAINIPAQPAGVVKLDTFVVSAKKNDGVIELDPYQVEGQREKPFTTANVDIPRTINDAQPYYIFDAKAIEQTGASSVEDFLKQRLPMNTTAQSNSQTAAGFTVGNISSINLRGLGLDKTLVLVNGRRVPGVVRDGQHFQPDINGIPLNAIERIEVLPTSASGIYGGSAIGGVINVILRQKYSGGEIRLLYNNTWDTDSPRKTVSATYGFSLENGRTQVMLSASWSTIKPLLLQDRRDLFDKNLATILRLSPSTIFTAGNAFLGSLPNINPRSNAQTTLTLKNGTVIPSRNTFVPAGTSPSTPANTLYAGLAANGGQWNLELPPTGQSPTGLLRPFGNTPTNKSFQANVRRQITRNLEAFVDYAYHGNDSTSTYFGSNGGALSVPAASPVNPFTTAVIVQTPQPADLPLDTTSTNRSIGIGLIAHLPRDWTAALDVSVSDNRFSSRASAVDAAKRTADLANGTLNPFVDTLLYPLDRSKYVNPLLNNTASELQNYALHGSGPIFSLPWGTPNYTVGIEYAVSSAPDSKNTSRIVAITPASSRLTSYYGQNQDRMSAYNELALPLLKKDALPFVHQLELQISGRADRYTVDTGTLSVTTNPTTGEVLFYSGTTRNGLPYFSKASYESTNGTVGLKFQPNKDLTLRASFSTAFLPPTPSDLLKNPLPDDFQSTVNDPVTGQNNVTVTTVSGGNPDLRPQSSTSFNMGVIWEPRLRLLAGLRVNLEYYSIEQEDAISFLDAQTIVSSSSIFPGRVTRDTIGNITLVDTSAVNLYKRKTDGLDVTLDYSRKTRIGIVGVRAAGSIIYHLKNQYSLTLPEYDAVNFPSEAGAAKYKGNGDLTWETDSWMVAWSARYVGSYKQRGAAGGPSATQLRASNPNAPLSLAFITPQGGDTIPSQVYHDLFVSYKVGGKRETGTRWMDFGSTILSDTTIQLGVKNLFDKAPPYDFFYSSNYYLSPYGDTRLRSYWISVKKTF